MQWRDTPLFSKGLQLVFRCVWGGAVVEGVGVGSSLVVGQPNAPLLPICLLPCTPQTRA